MYLLGGSNTLRAQPNSSPKWQGLPKFTALAALRSCGNIDLTVGGPSNIYRPSRLAHIPNAAGFAGSPIKKRGLPSRNQTWRQEIDHL